MDVYIGAWFVGVLGPVIVRVVLPFELGLSDFICFSECSYPSRRGLVSVATLTQILWAARYDRMTRRFSLSPYTSVVRRHSGRVQMPR